ncbi:hypothetical protein NDU88_005077, partial [Pleurodeles waltl]
MNSGKLKRQGSVEDVQGPASEIMCNSKMADWSHPFPVIGSTKDQPQRRTATLQKVDTENTTQRHRGLIHRKSTWSAKILRVKFTSAQLAPQTSLLNSSKTCHMNSKSVTQ